MQKKAVEIATVVVSSIKSVIVFLVLPNVFLSWASLLAAKPLRPKSVSPQAVYFARGAVWFLDQGGQRKIWYKKGALKAVGDYKAPHRIDKWRFYYPNGKKKGLGLYQKGKKSGLWQFFDQKKGYLKAEGMYQKGLQTGEWKFYYPNKKISSKGMYMKGRKEGLWWSYYQNGEVFYKGHFRRGQAQGKWKYYYKGGAFFQEGRLDKGLRVGLWNICVYPGGPCSQENYHRSRIPPPSNIEKIEGFPFKLPR